MAQVITITPSGGVSGLQVKPGKGLNLQSLGHAQTKRASEIVWDEDAQAWKIDVLQDVGKGVVTLSRWTDEAGLMVLTAPPCLFADEQGTMLFHTYDAAVEAEIAFLDALRLKGQF